MNRDNETPEEKRERLRQKELKHPASSIHGSNLSDLVGGLGWKGTGIMILVLVVAFVVYSVFFG
ncbi:DUF6366 family protein [Mammaliicoccus sciuri]|uniref:Phage capsid protein n=2 Tax=Sporosarcina newyorkensis TaxID=759851 RepID=A0A1T4XKC8_9BACL|nr:DUF6366 family protein [Sporosarcina newyorkensis]EGQ27941.1 hypothetical protein HMPREF9372_0049 [Sporosarcina newyorkensis 2681]SKA89967.1 hypothetical protein SAMN04244570_0911 [Sporosarcina newyorkensis]